MFSGMDFLSFIYWSFIQFLEFVGLYLSQNLRCFHSLLSFIFPPTIFYCLSRTYMIQNLSLVLLSHRPMKLSIFFSLFYFHCSNWVNSIDLSSGLLILFAVISTLLLSPSRKFFFSFNCYSFQFYNFFWFFFMTFICWDFFFFPF